MIAELGLAVLWLAAALSVLQLISGSLALRSDILLLPNGRGAALAGIVRPLAVEIGRAHV